MIGTNEIIIGRSEGESVTFLQFHSVCVELIALIELIEQGTNPETMIIIIRRRIGTCG